MLFAKNFVYLRNELTNQSKIPNIMLSQQDLQQIVKKGITEEQINTQLGEFKTGFPFLKLKAAASI